MRDRNDTAAYDAYCDNGALAEIECQQCGDTHSPTHCPWAETCAECSRSDVEMAESRLCCDCAESMERVAKRDRLDAIREGRWDHMRDAQKDAR